ncbi:hypothetical protein EDC01DRAFT_645352 [Geopyxis carbonaria]|nr:hypothetical protein EDC01DRAFT_645352 [Geopyxis carbonaria]
MDRDPNSCSVCGRLFDNAAAVAQHVANSQVYYEILRHRTPSVGLTPPRTRLRHAVADLEADRDMQRAHVWESGFGKPEEDEGKDSVVVEQTALRRSTFAIIYPEFKARLHQSKERQAPPLDAVPRTEGRQDQFKERQAPPLGTVPHTEGSPALPLDSATHTEARPALPSHAIPYKANAPPGVYCGICEREFRSEDGLRAHVENSKVHRKNQRSHAENGAAEFSGFCRVVYAANPAHPGKQENHGTSSFIASTFSYGGKEWSVIQPTESEAILAALRSNMHTLETLVQNQYVVRPYTKQDIDGMAKCRKCNHRKNKATPGSATTCLHHPGTRRKEKPPRTYTCCNESNRGCTTNSKHEYIPPHDIKKYRKFASTRATAPFRRAAVALDCEMAGAMDNSSILVQICAVDFLTGETLLNSLIDPTQPIRDWRTRISGISAGDVSRAKARGEALNGWEGARAALWEFVDADTVLVGHALQHDLTALRICHARVVDSQILTATGYGHMGLKKLCADLAKVPVQDGRSHDCLEDALGAREVVVWCMRNPEELQKWVVNEGEKRRLEREQKNKSKGKGKKTGGGSSQTAMARRNNSYYADEDSGDDDEYGDMSLEDFNELVNYPREYDNWSS